MGERQSWHTYIPYTDRVDYLGGVMNNLAYLTAVEMLAGIRFRRAPKSFASCWPNFSALSATWYGTALLRRTWDRCRRSSSRSTIVSARSASSGRSRARYDPGWFRIGGVAADLPKGWENIFAIS